MPETPVDPRATSDPVFVVADVTGLREPIAERVLVVLRQNGWRLVRSGDCANPDAGIGQCGCHETRITEEWTGS